MKNQNEMTKRPGTILFSVMKNQNEILEVIAEIKRREVKLEETISSVRPELVEMEWKQLIKIRRYRNELEKELSK